jgi:hypothetical protein
VAIGIVQVGRYTIENVTQRVSSNGRASASQAYDLPRLTYTNLNSDIPDFKVEVDGAGNITQWVISVYDSVFPVLAAGEQGYDMYTLNTSATQLDESVITECASFSDYCTDLSFDVASTFDSPGNWSVVPVPAAVWLFGSGLGLLGWFRRRQTA